MANHSAWKNILSLISDNTLVLLINTIFQPFALRYRTYPAQNQ